MNKKGNILAQGVGLLFRYWWLIIIILIIYFGFFYSATFVNRQQIIGSYHIDSYNPQTNEITIKFSADNIQYSSGELAIERGTYYCQSVNVFNKEECQSLFGADMWSDYWGGGCCYINFIETDYFKNKPYSAAGSCTTTCADTRGCGDLPYQQTSTYAVTNANLGIESTGMTHFILSTNSDNWKKTSCSGTIIFNPAAPAGNNIETPSNLPATDNPSTSLVECTSSSDCISVCGTKTPTCNNKCYCDNQAVVIQTTQTGFLYLISKFIQNIFDKIFSIFSK